MNAFLSMESRSKRYEIRNKFASRALRQDHGEFQVKVQPIADQTTSTCYGGDNKIFPQTDGGAERNFTTYGLNITKLTNADIVVI